MLEYHNDKSIKFEYDPQINMSAFKVNEAGVTAGDSISVADYTYSDANTIFVSDTIGSDITGAGTQTNPYETIGKGINETTAVKNRVVVLDSILYAEDISVCTYTFFNGLYAATGQTPKLSLRELGYVPSDSNSIFVDKTGNDTTGAGTQSSPFLTVNHAIDQCDATHQNVVIQDSNLYLEDPFEFIGNFKGLYAALGCAPIINITVIKNTEIVAPTVFESASSSDYYVAALQNGNWVCCYSEFTNNGRFVIYNQAGVQVVAPTVFSSGYTRYCSVVVLQNGNWVCCYNSSDNNGKFVIYSQAGVQVVAPTVFDSGAAAFCSVDVLQNGNWVCCYIASGENKFVIYSQAGVQVVAPTIFDSGNNQSFSVAVLQNGNWVCCYLCSDGDDNGKFVIYSQAGVQVVAPTVFESGWTTYCSVAVLQNGNWVCCYKSYTSGGKFVIYSQAGVQVVAPTVFDSASTTAYQSVAVLQDGNWVCCYQKSITDGQFVRYSQAGVQIVAPTEFISSNFGSCSVAVLQNGNWICCFGGGRFVIYQPFSLTGVEVSTEATMNGIQFDCEGEGYLRYAIEGNAAKIILNWCEIIKCKSSNCKDFIGWAVYSNDELDINNCIIHDNGGGIYSQTDKAIIEECLFYWNADEKAIYVDGAAAASGDIRIEHCDFFANKQGIHLENNDGSNEIVKNCIFHDNDIYGIEADTEITLSYSIITDAKTGVADGASVVAANPFYVNEGSIDEDDIDLNIKTRSIGYSVDSPAKDLADDDRNVGAYNVEYAGLIPSWTAATVDKPQTGIKIWYESVGKTKIIKQDGSVSTFKNAVTEFLSLKYSGINNTQFSILQAIWMADSSEVRIYPDPITNSNDYNVYKLIYNKLSGSPDHYKLSRTGVAGVELVFARSFEL